MTPDKQQTIVEKLRSEHMGEDVRALVAEVDRLRAVLEEVKPFLARMGTLQDDGIAMHLYVVVKYALLGEVME